MESYIQTKRYLLDTISEIEDGIDDLTKWTAYNDDDFSWEIMEFQKLFEELKKKIEDK